MTFAGVARVELPSLPKEVAEMILDGKWSLYRLPDGTFAVQTPAQNACCNREEQKTYACAPDGAVVSRISALPTGATYVILEQR